MDKQKWLSRKWLLVVATVALVVLNEGIGLGIPEEAYWAVVLPVIGYVFGESYVDANRDKW